MEPHNNTYSLLDDIYILHKFDKSAVCQGGNSG